MLLKTSSAAEKQEKLPFINYIAQYDQPMYFCPIFIRNNKSASDIWYSGREGLLPTFAVYKKSDQGCNVLIKKKKKKKLFWNKLCFCVKRLIAETICSWKFLIFIYCPVQIKLSTLDLWNEIIKVKYFS